MGGIANLSAPARCAALTALMDLRGRRAAAEGHARAGDAEPVRCNATLVAGEPAAVAADALRWAGEGFSTFKLKLGVGDDAGQVRAVREAVGPEARIRVDANAAWDVDRAMRILAELEELDIELAEQPVATLEEAAEVAAATSIPIAADESVESRADAELAVVAAGLRAGRGQALQGRRTGGGDRDRRGAAVLPLQRPRRPGRDRRRGAGGADAGRRTLPPAPPTSPTAWRPSASSPRRWPPASASCATACCTRRQGPASASRSTSGRWSCIGSSLTGRFSFGMRKTKRPTILWTRPTPTPPSPRPSSRSSLAAGCGTRSSPPARARRRWRWRSGGRRRSR